MATANPRALLDAVFAKSKKNGLNVGPLGSIIEDQKWVSTGNIAIDNAFGGGIPMGRQLEFFGPTQCGKTTLVLQACVAMQKIIVAGGDPELGIGPDDVVLYVDYESTMDIRYAIALGLDPTHPSFQITQPDTLEQGADLIQNAVKTGLVRLVAVDSVAAMVPSAQLEAESVGKAQVAIVARLLKTFGQNLNPILRNHNATVLWINHETDVIGGFSRPGMPTPTTTPGGKSGKYFATIRAQFRPIKNFKGEYTDPLTGEVMEIRTMTDVRLTVVKNKVATPYREAILRVRFGRGFDPFWTAMQILLSNKKVVYGESKYFFHPSEEDGLVTDWMPRMKTGTKRPYVSAVKDGKILFKTADQHPEWRQAVMDLAAKIAAENIDKLEGISFVEPEEDDTDDDEIQDFDEVLGATASASGRRVEI